MNVEHLWKTYGLTANLKRKKETSRGEIMKKKKKVFRTQGGHMWRESVAVLVEEQEAATAR